MTTQSFASLKKQSAQQLASLTAELEKMTPAGRSDDDRFWKPTTGKDGNGYAVIRFLPAPPNENVPFVRLWNHAFQGPTGGWYIENSLTTLGKDDPVSQMNQELWATGTKENQAIVRSRKRRLSFFSNIYVVKDPANPENEGKVFLFRYGKKIFDMISRATAPEFEDEQAFNPFDMWAGANFKMKMRTVDGYVNYDLSEFAAPGPLLEDDKQLEQVWNSQYSLQELVSPDKFKSYDQLKERLVRTLGLGADLPQTSSRAAASRDEDVIQTPQPSKRVEQKSSVTDDDDIDFEALRRLVEDE